MLTIKDLALDQDMNKQAMAAVLGGRHRLWANYNFTRSFRRSTYRSYTRVFRKGRRKYLAIQKHWTHLRASVQYVGQYSVRRIG